MYVCTQKTSHGPLTRIIAGVTTLGDASVLMWLLVEYFAINEGYSLVQIFTCYGVITIVISAALIVLWLMSSDILDGTDDLPSAEAMTETEYGTIKSHEEFGPQTRTKEIVPLSEKSLSEQLCSIEFAFILLFQGIHVTRGNMFLGHLAYFFESQQFAGVPPYITNKYVNITSALVPLGCICAPLVERIIEWYGFGVTAHIIAMIGALYSILMLSTDISMQIVTAVLFLIYRANVFAFPTAFAGRVFGPRTVGRVTGMMFTVMSPVQFLIDPALRLTFTVFHNDFRPLTLILLASLIPIVCLTFVLQRVSKEESVKVPSTEERQAHPVHIVGSPGPSPHFHKPSSARRREDATEREIELGHQFFSRASGSKR